MKPFPIAMACLLLGGSGVALFAVLDRAAIGTDHDTGLPTSRSQPGTSRLRSEASPVPGHRFRTVLEAGGRPDHMKRGQPSPAAVSAPVPFQPGLVPPPAGTQAWRDDETPRRPAPPPRMAAAWKTTDSQTVADLTGPLATAGSSLSTATAHPNPIYPEFSPNSDPSDPAQGENEEPGLTISVPFSAVDPAVPAAIPAVLAERVAESGLSEPELAGVAELAGEFIAKVTGGPQNPQDAVHQKRWAEAQAESDAQMRTRYGGHAWLKHHQEAYRQARGTVIE